MVCHDEVIYPHEDNRVVIRLQDIFKKFSIGLDAQENKSDAYGSNKPRKKYVVLTFDDGPSRCLYQILDILAHYNVPALFFWLGKYIHPQRPWKRVLDEGHLIGSHSWKHRDLTKLSYQEQLADLQLSKDKVEEITGVPITYFRPPFGRYNTDTLLAVETLNMIPMLWHVSTHDWLNRHHPKKISENGIRYSEDGSILLCHELQQTTKALPELIEGLLDKDVQFVLPPIYPRSSRQGASL
ncbi:polysaccharide deacetylase family protein [Microaerobacter geothermalis]|uniref:polysaccharide deacetylase family protein n=1 Tax=Microaerobacter geothermalis TaxID=674972 RepID=UPI001F1846B6|nr:polysaccharide deacetylase family protein [Microaerobacter geothermalis]MCF6094556.1 polysaccharide deacetylase family protein [Microaerobacter geothermalis]